MSLSLRNYALFFVTAMSLSAIANAAEEEKDAVEEIPNWKEDTLTGDWGGKRAELYKKGIDLGFTHKSDFWANVSGGVKRGGEWIGHTEGRLTLDLEKMLGWTTTTAHILYHVDSGSKFAAYYVGGLGVDNIEVPKNTGQVYLAWIQKTFMNDNISVLAGMYALDTEFYVTDTSGLFLAPPYGMANEVAQSGKNGPPVFPVGTPAVRVALTSPDKNFYFMGAITNGMPGDLVSHDGTQINLDGSLKMVEFGWTPQADETKAEAGKESAKEQEVEAEVFHKTAIGFWSYSARKDDLSDLDGAGNPVRRRDYGAYFLTEHSLYAEPGHPSQGLAGFFRLGFASEDINQVDWTSSIGLRYHGLIAGRDDDIAGVAMTINHASDKYRSLNTAESHETGVELTYREQIKPWFAVQPNLQYIINPNMDPTIKNAWVLGLRTEFEF
jgi:porin